MKNTRLIAKCLNNAKGQVCPCKKSACTFHISHKHETNYRDGFAMVCTPLF